MLVCSKKGSSRKLGKIQVATITIDVSDETLALLEELAQRCTETNQEREGATTHGDLTVSGLLTMRRRTPPC